MSYDITASCTGSSDTAPKSGFNTNILILGKTGVGKSSLVNYLYGQNIAIAKSGKPVTLLGFHKHPSFKYKSLNVTVYDSWGLEPDKVDEWRDDLHAELEKADSSNIADWFHTVIYCYDAKRSRLDDYERIHIIDELISKGVRIIFAMTKWGLCSEREKNAAGDILKKYYPDFSRIPIESVSQKLRNQTQTVQCGRDELFHEMCLNLRENLIYKLISRTESSIKQASEKSGRRVLEYYDRKAGLFTIYGSDFLNEIKNTADKTYKENLSAVYKDFVSIFTQINAMSKSIIMTYSGLSINEDGRIIDEILSRHTDNVRGWENSVSEYVFSLLSAISWPTLLIRRFWIKRKYRNEIEKNLGIMNTNIMNDFKNHLTAIRNTENNIKEKFLKSVREKMNKQ